MTDRDEDDEGELGGLSTEKGAPIPPELQRAFTTADLPGISGKARAAPEDFLVEEVPLYEASGEGEHLYVAIEKRGVPTLEAIRRLSRALGVQAREVGYAGMKDARAVTRQTLSFPRVVAGRLSGFKDAQVAILSTKLHGNKLKLGHLRGNRFTIRLRGVAEGDETRAAAILERLAKRGAPNFFGLQRFGSRRSSQRLGLALVREDALAFVEELLGRPTVHESPRLQEAREAYAKNDQARALQLFPPSFEAERSALVSLARAPDDHARAAAAVSLKWRRLYVSALQGFLFNRYLSRRLDRIDRLEKGEIAFLHRNGAAFLVQDEAVEQKRADANEISPSGPVFGAKLLRPAEGSGPRADEDAVLAESSLLPELSQALGASPRGERRALRVIVADARAEREGEDLVLRFFLPKGCYATSVLEELLRRPLD